MNISAPHNPQLLDVLESLQRKKTEKNVTELQF